MVPPCARNAFIFHIHLYQMDNQFDTAALNSAKTSTPHYSHAAFLSNLIKILKINIINKATLRIN